MATRKLCSIEKIIFKALVDFYSSHEELLLVINEKQNCFRAEYNQLRDHERDISIKHEKIIGQNEIQSAKIKTDIKAEVQNKLK